MCYTDLLFIYFLDIKNLSLPVFLFVSNEMKKWIIDEKYADFQQNVN